MKPRTQKQDSEVIVYDADCLQQPDKSLFNPEHWRGMGAITGEAMGRGSAWFLDTGFGPAVLRQYLRGGQAARISRDRYFFNGFERSRPVREFHVTAELYSRELPVPRPLAAICRRSGLFYTGALITARIMNAQPLAERLGSEPADSRMWQILGTTLRRFHLEGVTHADLNARNILLQHEKVFLIDFDRASLSHGRSVNAEANLRRLRRSFVKLWPKDAVHDLDTCWKALMAGYLS